MKNNIRYLGMDCRYTQIGGSLVIQADCFDWLAGIPENCLHAIVTDPPYGLLEYDSVQLQKRASGKGGVWRIPPSFDGACRSPVPRFTALNDSARKKLSSFFSDWAKTALRPLCPGGHVFIASNTFLSQIVFSGLVAGGMEYRGTIVRLVRTLRGGDRPKNAEKEFGDVCSLPRGCWEPWGLFRRPMPKGMKVSDCLKTFGTGGLRRKPCGNPFEDVIGSAKTPKEEREIANHPSLKPQSFMRPIVYASLPLGKGIIADPFMGSGSTIAAAEAVGYRSVGVEKHEQYFDAATKAIKVLSEIDA